MQRQVLEGHSILVIEGEPSTVTEITNAFEATGAALTITNTLSHALIVAEHDRLSAAILGRAVGDADGSLLSKRLKARGIPFMIYRESDTVDVPCEDALLISQPAADGALVAAIERLIKSGDLLPQGNERVTCATEAGGGRVSGGRKGCPRTAQTDGIEEHRPNRPRSDGGRCRHPFGCAQPPR